MNNYVHKARGPIHLPTPAGAGFYDVVDNTILGSRHGDIAWYDAATDTVKPASSFPWTTSIAVTQKLFAPHFVGFQLGNVDGADAAGTRAIESCGEFLVPCSSATYLPGQLLGVAKQSGNALERFKLAAVTHPASAIAQVTRASGASATQVWCKPLVRRIGAGFNPQFALHTYSFYVTDTTGDVVSDFTFGRQVALLSLKYVQTVIQSSADKTFTPKKGATSLTTLVIAVSGAAVGKVTEQTYDPSVANNQFDADDLLDIADDGGGAGSGTLILEVMDWPL